ncbi:MAG: hypothetical protein AAFN70_19125, partial [Planctomycetota bacterium]
NRDGTKLVDRGFDTRWRIATVPTFACQQRSQAMRAFQSLGGDVVVKPLFGGEGRGIMRLIDPQQAWTVFGSLQQSAAAIILQPFLAPGGIERRVLIIDDVPLVFQRTNDREFRTNRPAGGETRQIDAGTAESQQLIAVSKRVQQAMGLRYAAIDFLPSASSTSQTSQWLFSEINAVPGWRSAQIACAEDIALRLLRHLKRDQH